MPKLEACPACDKKISINAKDCPSCGEPLPKRWHEKIAEKRKEDSFGGTALLILIIIIGSTVAYCSYESDEDKQARSQQKYQQSKVIDEDKALLICLRAYRNNATYDHDVGVSDHVNTFTMPDKNQWKVLINGKLQNRYGAWQRIRSGCVVNKENANPEDMYDLRNLESFDYLD